MLTSVAFIVVTSCPQNQSLARTGRLCRRNSPSVKLATQRRLSTMSSGWSTSCPSGLCQSSLQQTGHMTTWHTSHLSLLVLVTSHVSHCDTVIKVCCTYIVKCTRSSPRCVSQLTVRSSLRTQCRTHIASCCGAYKQGLCHMTCQLRVTAHTPNSWQDSCLLRHCFCGPWIVHCENSVTSRESTCYFMLTELFVLNNSSHTIILILWQMTTLDGDN